MADPQDIPPVSDTSGEPSIEGNNAQVAPEVKPQETITSLFDEPQQVVQEAPIEVQPTIEVVQPEVVIPPAEPPAQPEPIAEVAPPLATQVATLPEEPLQTVIGAAQKNPPAVPPNGAFLHSQAVEEVHQENVKSAQ